MSDVNISIDEFLKRDPIQLTSHFIKHNSIYVEVGADLIIMQYVSPVFFKMNSSKNIIAFRHLKPIPKVDHSCDEEYYDELDKHPISPLDIKGAVRRFIIYVKTRKAGKKSRVKHISEEELAILE